jgi:hypothetical protein
MTKKTGLARVNQTGRNKGKIEPYVRLPHWMLKSPAWMNLSGNAIKTLLHLWERHNGGNNGEIVYAVRDAEAIGLSKSSADRALDELVTAGFLRVVTGSAFTMKNRRATAWALTAEPIGGERPTKDFMRREDAGENNTQSHRRDAQSHGRDTQRRKAIKLPLTVPPAGLSTHQTPLSQSHGRDTYIYTMGDVADGEREASDDQPQTIEQPDEHRSADRRVTVSPLPAHHDREPHQIDLEEFIAASLSAEKPAPTNSGAASRCVPADVVRERIKAEGIKIGELAKALGVAGPTMSNRLSPRHAARPTKFSLNATAEAALSAWVAGRPLPGMGSVH